MRTGCLTGNVVSINRYDVPENAMYPLISPDLASVIAHLHLQEGLRRAEEHRLAREARPNPNPQDGPAPVHRRAASTRHLLRLRPRHAPV